MEPRRPLAEGLSDLILDDILSGKYGDGVALPSEAELAQHFGMSRLTVREAVKDLRSKKVLNVVQGRGTTVNPPDQWSVLDPVLLIARSSIGSDGLSLERKLLEARRVVEVVVAQMAAKRRTDEQLAQMQRSIASMRESATDGNVDAFVEADIAFHQSVMEAASNPFIQALFEPLSKILYLTRHRTSSFALVRDHAIMSHQEIYNAILDRKSAVAADAMAQHLNQTEADLNTFVLTPDRSLFTVRRRPENEVVKKQGRDTRVPPSPEPNILSWE